MKNLLLVIFAGFALVTNLPQPAQIITKPVIAQAQVIDTQAVINSVKAKAQIVGLEGSLSKSISYTDQLYQSNTALDKLGTRKFAATFDAIFKLGVNADDIKIHCKNNTVIVILPEPVLISLEVNNIQFNSDTGLLRRQLNDQEKLTLLTKATETARFESMSEANKKQATESVKAIIKGLISQVQGVERVDFI